MMYFRFTGKLALQQRVLPNYRAPFLDLLASACEGGLSLFTGLPRPMEGIATTDELRVADYHVAKNIHLFRNSFYVCYQPGLIDWLNNRDPDALIVEANPRYLSTPSAVRWMHRRGRPVIGWGLGAPRFDSAALSASSKGIGGKVWSSFINQFDAMISYSQRGADEYAALGFPCERIFVAQNSVSPPPSFPLPVRPSTFNRSSRPSPALPGTVRTPRMIELCGAGDRCAPGASVGESGQAVKPYLLFVGRLQARKRVDWLLKACAQLESKPRLIIVGDGPERATLESLAKEIYPSAEFIGARHGAELKPYFMEADLFVLPGTGGLAIQEAMSYGLPVIVAQGDGTQDDLVREENGWQIPPGDFDALLSTMKEALSDVARLRRMGAESYRIVKEEINIEQMVETFLTALNRLS